MKDQAGHPLLCLAVAQGNQAMVELLLSQGAKVHVRDLHQPEGVLSRPPPANIYEMAREESDPRSVRVQPAKQYWVQVTDAVGIAPLDLAVARGDKAMVDLLLERYQDLSMDQEVGSLTLRLAIKQGNLDLVEPLLDRSRDIYSASDDFAQAVEGKEPQIIKLMLSRFSSNDSLSEGQVNDLVEIALTTDDVELLGLVLDKRSEHVRLPDERAARLLDFALGKDDLPLVKRALGIALAKAIVEPRESDILALADDEEGLEDLRGLSSEEEDKFDFPWR